MIFRKVESAEELEQIYRLRYQVYCLERGFEPEERFQDSAEKDEYDAHSIHFIAEIDTEVDTTRSRVVGTARLILNNPIGFPVERYCKLNISGCGMKREQTAEISRLAVSKEVVKATGCDRQGVVLGLIREVYQESKSLGINYYCAVMGKGLQKLLSRCGIVFIQAGSTLDYHGIRAPYVSEIRSLEESVFVKNSNLFRFFTSPAIYQYT